MMVWVGTHTIEGQLKKKKLKPQKIIIYYNKLYSD